MYIDAILLSVRVTPSMARLRRDIILIAVAVPVVALQDY